MCTLLTFSLFYIKLLLFFFYMVFFNNERLFNLVFKKYERLKIIVFISLVLNIVLIFPYLKLRDNDNNNLFLQHFIPSQLLYPAPFS